MVTVHRAHGYLFVMFANDHSPPHVHVFGHGGEARIVLDDPDGPRLDWITGIGRSEVRKIMQEVKRERARMIRMWSTLHG